MCHRRRQSQRKGGGVLVRLLALNTGRGHRRARILEFHRAQDGTAWARC
jgi:hypothetical protein